MTLSIGIFSAKFNVPGNSLLVLFALDTGTGQPVPRPRGRALPGGVRPPLSIALEQQAHSDS